MRRVKNFASSSSMKMKGLDFVLTIKRICDGKSRGWFCCWRNDVKRIFDGVCSVNIKWTRTIKRLTV